MGRKGRLLAIFAGFALFASVAATAAFGAPQADPGITKTSVHIGGTFPLTGVASAYKTIPAAESAYYAYVDAHGGVNGRKIDFTVLDDAYNPAQTVPDVQQLVEQDNVFALVGDLGTAPALATWGYTNAHKVPQVFLATGDSYWGNCVHKACQGSPKPYTIGWQPDYIGEGRLYGKYIAANMPNAKIGIIYQNDAFGANYIVGLVQGLGAKKSLIVDKEGFNATDTTVTQQILALKAKGADTLFIVATPGQAIASLVTATKIGWSPQVFLANVSNIRPFLLAAAQAGANLDGVISSGYVEAPDTQASLAGMKLGKQIIDQYAPALSSDWALGDSNLVYGMAVAWTFVYALQNAGKNPTRASLMASLRSMNTSANPFVYPGIKIQTSATDGFPIEQLILEKWSGGGTGDMHPIGTLQVAGH
ncbi:MAG TPA: ABC transporter substrate-binding protein [Gaiellaceae bacterium]|nr:ABC transporter substrate-binding protein [Gaiellaceae bacterium]